MEKTISLVTQIRKVITYRVMLCLLLLSIMVFFFSLYDIFNSLSQFQKNIKLQCDSLKSFVVSQLLIDNETAIFVRLDQLNHEQDTLHFSWTKIIPTSTTNKVTWSLPWSWDYYYPIISADNTKLGYLRVHGSLLFEKLLYRFLIRMAFLMIFALSMFSLLFPIAKRIPHLLFIKPINELLRLITIEDNKDQTQQPHFTTEIAELSEKIKKLLNDVGQKNREEALLQLASQVAHDIRSPIAALNIIVKQATSLPEQQRVIIRNAAQQINDIANNMLMPHHTKLHEHNETQYLPIVCPELIFTLLDNSLSAKRAQYAEHPIDIQLHIANNAYGVFANVEALNFKRVISNLINNAVEAMQHCGIVNVRLNKLPNHLLINIQDFGCGMSPDLLTNILKGGISMGKNSGNGLGLASSKIKVESWGGTFSIDSAPGKGTTITIELPTVSVPAWFRPALTFFRNSTIVILDDDPTIHDVWRLRLQHEVCSKHHIQLLHFDRADAFLREHRTPIAHAHYLIDFELLGSKMSGLDVIEKTQLAAHATLVTSSYEDENVRRRAAALDCKILPKNYAPYVPLCVFAPQPDVVLIDDDKLITQTWRMTAESYDQQIVTFHTIAEARHVIPFFAKNTPIYIDSNLSPHEKGEDFAKELFALGFYELYLATGYNKEHFKEPMPWIKAIVSKGYPLQALHSN